jgi:FtsH-binding integral membrane protein
MSYGLEYPIAGRAEASDRAAFIRRTYAHLAGAILAFVGLEAVLLRVVDTRVLFQTFFQSNMSYLVLLLAFIAAGWVARYWAHTSPSPGMQYLGLALYVVVEAIIFLPILYIADRAFPEKNLIAQAGVLTLTIFGGLTTATLVTRRDFSYLGPILCVGSWIALGLIVAAIIFGFSLGLVFAFAMVALACGFILYDTSNVLHRFRTDQHVGAALELFASVALLFWYILRILIALSSRD